MNMKANKCKYSILSFFVFLLFISFISFPQAKERKVIRVGYPLQDGFTMKDEKGNRYGYDYDYLNQIAQYTGWEYEYVEVEGNINERLLTLLDMLEKGEIDILGAVRYNEQLAKLYDYPSEPYGNIYSVVVSGENSDLIDLNTLLTKKNLRIAVRDISKKQIDQLDQYAATNGFQYEKVLCATNDELINSVKNDLADAFLTSDLAIPKKYYPIIKFSPEPFYFAVTKGRSDLINELNQAMENINLINPTLTSTLYNRYFSPIQNGLALTEKEKAYIGKHQRFKVLVRDDSAPIQYLMNDKTTGIGKDILDYLSTETGITFDYIVASSYEEYEKYCLEHNVDILLGLPYETSIADQFQVKLSDPYINIGMDLVTSKNVDPTNLTKYTQAMTKYSDQQYDANEKISYFESPEEIMLAINSGSADYVYLNSYLVTYYLNKHNLRDISTYPTSDYLRSQYAFGVIESDDLTLLSIMNKAIRACEPEMNNIILKNGYIGSSVTLQDFLADHLIETFIMIFIIALIIVISIHRHYRNQLSMKNEIELEYQRFLKLSEMSNEMTFTYDYRQDQLKINSSGMNRLANQSVLEPFSKIAQNNQNVSDVEKKIYTYLMHKKDIREEVQLSLVNKKMNWFLMNIKVITVKEKNSEKAVYAVGRVQDISKEKEERDLLRQKSQTDYLTGIWNRAGAQELIYKASAFSQGIQMFVMLDLDNFKYVNDTYGHYEGDRVLLETAVLLNEIYLDAIVARLGGDEFIIYKTDIDQKDVTAFCETTLERIKQLPCMKKHHTHVSVSMGVVLTNQHFSLESLIQYADKNLYEVKRNGRDGYCITELYKDE